MILYSPPEGFEQRKLLYGPYSPSRLITANCPQRFFAQYVRKDRVVSQTLASARGSAIHEILSRITTVIQKKETLTSRQLADWVSEVIGMYPAAYPQIDLVRKAAEAYVANPSPYINASTSCEKAFAIQLWEEVSFDDRVIPAIKFVAVPYVLEDGRTNPEAFFGGKLDQVSVDEETKTVTILDHKSTPSANENEDHTFQIGAYAWLVSLSYPGYLMKTVIHYCHPSLNFYSAPTIWYAEDLLEMQSVILGRIFALERLKSFDAVPGSGCSYCHIIQECDLYQKVSAQKSKGVLDLNARSFQDLLRLAKELHVVDALSAEITNALKAGITTLCPTKGVNIGGITYGFKKNEESVHWEKTDQKVREESRRAKSRCEENSFENEEDRTWCETISKLESIDDILKKFGVDPNSFKNYNGAKMKNIWKLDKEELIEALKKVIVRDSLTRFGGHKSFN